MSPTRIAVIMAGGAGERFWPVSRKKRPKQLLRFGNSPPMLQQTIDLISPLVPLQRVFIITGEILRSPIKQALKKFPPENIICEPEGRNTAPCLALAAAIAKKKFGNPTMAVLTADHLISNRKKFEANARAAFEFAESQNALITFGVKPSRPDTGFGYIEAGRLADKKRGGKIFNVKRFCEKPDLHTARRFLKAGNFYWNSGMFFWQTDALIAAFEKFAPKYSRGIEIMVNALGGKGNKLALTKAFKSLPRTSIDYAVMEKADNVFMVEAEFGWEDIGAWTALDKLFPKDRNKNVSFGTCELLECRDSVFYNATKNKLLAAYGLSDLVVIMADDAVLVCRREDAQKVKKIVENLKAKKDKKFI